MDAGATQVGNFSEQVWVLSGERHHPEHPRHQRGRNQWMTGIPPAAAASGTTAATGRAAAADHPAVGDAPGDTDRAGVAVGRGCCAGTIGAAITGRTAGGTSPNPTPRPRRHPRPARTRSAAASVGTSHSARATWAPSPSCTVTAPAKSENDNPIWPHRAGLIWPHPRFFGSGSGPVGGGVRWGSYGGSVPAGPGERGAEAGSGVGAGSVCGGGVRPQIGSGRLPGACRDTKLARV